MSAAKRTYAGVSPDDLAFRLGITLVALMVYRLGCHLPVPGLDAQFVPQLAKSMATGTAAISFVSRSLDPALARRNERASRRAKKAIITPCGHRGQGWCNQQDPETTADPIARDLVGKPHEKRRPRHNYDDVRNAEH